MSYELSGQFLEACDCTTLCPCWVGQPPDQNVCNGLFAWRVDRGSIDGTGVGGLRVVSVSHHIGNRADGGQQVAVFVDPSDVVPQHREHWSSGEGLKRIVAVFLGQDGGPLQGLFGLLGKHVNAPKGTDEAAVRAAYRRYIDIQVRDRGGDFSITVLASDSGVPALVGATGKGLPGEAGNPIRINDSSLAVSLGKEAFVGKAERFSLFVEGFADEYWLDIDLRGRSATSGRFDYGAEPA